MILLTFSYFPDLFSCRQFRGVELEITFIFVPFYFCSLFWVQDLVPLSRPRFLIGQMTQAPNRALEIAEHLWVQVLHLMDLMTVGITANLAMQTIVACLFMQNVIFPRLLGSEF